VGREGWSAVAFHAFFPSPTDRRNTSCRLAAVNGKPHPPSSAGVPLFWRVFATNAVVLVLAAVVLALSPATISFPVAVTEALVLVVGLTVMLAFNFALLRRAFSPLEALRVLMRGADPLRPGVRAPSDHATPELRAVIVTFNEMVERLEAERRESASRALAAQESERLRIAQELHDEVGQKLTAVMLQLDGLARADPAPAFVAAREGVRESLEEVRVIASRLRPEALDDLGLVSALVALTNSFERAGTMTVQRRIEKALPDLHPNADLVVYRVAQEALTNAVRHGGSDEARLVLRRVRGGVQLEVFDRGAGFDPEQLREGSGIRGMRERALLAGATLELESAPSRGTVVRLRLPADQVAQTTSS
jgi:two-component system sensor histidine kinase UhpB